MKICALTSCCCALVFNFSLSIELIPKKIKLISPKTDLRTFSYWIERNIDLNICLADATFFRLQLQDQLMADRYMFLQK